MKLVFKMLPLSPKPTILTSIYWSVKWNLSLLKFVIPKSITNVRAAFIQKTFLLLKDTEIYSNW